MRSELYASSSGTICHSIQMEETLELARLASFYKKHRADMARY